MLIPSPPPPSAAPSVQDGPVEDLPLPGSSPNPNGKTYLSLLPSQHIIDLCLLFEPHVPLHVKSTVWPADLEAAILELKEKASSCPPSQPQPDAPITPLPIADGPPQTASSSTDVHQVHPPGHYAASTPVTEDPPMGSLKDPAEEARAQASRTTSTLPTTVPQQNVVNPSSSNTPNPSQTQPALHTATPQQPQPLNNHPPVPYPYTPYGYPMPQPQPQGQRPAYPHAPYYPLHAYPSHYPYPPYPPPPGYPAPPAGHSSSPPPHAHGSQPMFNANHLSRPPPHPSGAPPQPPPPSGEDLPSYEEMIVEALLDCGDAEGAAPKDLFTWMASRYPLQTNFRPSASQALQKAYKRGRLEKRAGGKYRLNASWEGGATSKRTTRRPQTLAQTTYAMHHPTQPSSPFTHFPLQQHQPQTPAQHPPPYNGYPYPYSYGHYPGYPPSQPPTQSSQDIPAALASEQLSNIVTAKPGEAKDESADAWEAAQHILKAINFGGLAGACIEANTNAPVTPDAASGSASPLISAMTDDDFGAVLTALANAAAVASSEPPRTTLTNEERASLQAQLALLAAQLTEIADAEEEDVPSQPSGPTMPATQGTPMPNSESAQPARSNQPSPLVLAPRPEPAPAPAKTAEPPPMPITAYHGAGAHVVLDVNAFPEVFSSSALALPTGGASGAQTEVDDLGGGDSDDDDDMEDVVVPLPAGHAALRT